MEQEFLTRAEHLEFARRMDTENARRDDENNRQNHRLELLEKNVEETRRLTISTERLAVNMESLAESQKVMTQELSKQSERIGAIEQKPGKTWDNLKWTIIAAIATGIVGMALGVLLRGIGGS